MRNINNDKIKITQKQLLLDLTGEDNNPINEDLKETITTIKEEIKKQNNYIVLNEDNYYYISSNNQEDLKNEMIELFIQDETISKRMQYYIDNDAIINELLITHTIYKIEKEA